MRLHLIQVHADSLCFELRRQSFETRGQSEEGVNVSALIDRKFWSAQCGDWTLGRALPIWRWSYWEHS